MKAQERETLLQALKARFEAHMHRHTGIPWADVQAQLDAHPVHCSRCTTWRLRAASQT